MRKPLRNQGFFVALNFSRFRLATYGNVEQRGFFCPEFFQTLPKPLETGLWSLDGRLIVARSDENMVRVWDATTGEPVTPVLQHESYVRLARLVMTNRLVTLSMPNVLRAWDLKEVQLPTDVITDYAKLLSGRRLNAQGVLLALSPQELAGLLRSLAARAPELFTTP
jgi:WD40 repeat protein